ncbi:hypothetical protein A9F13_01g05489 [Clavispora lusitaniae]|uniref:Protein SOK1 n=1 Tax=Clavispora lusitaniae TaxID=36911 RepID=A0AA91Q4T0_CLALS|nr:hypothetical protein A9F13_01g05489 [Clavispora lusitaniae]
MNSQLNNTNENQDQVFSETETFRPVFFDSSSKRNSSAAAVDPSKRARLDASVIAPEEAPPDSSVSPSSAPVSDSALASQNTVGSNASSSLLKHHPSHIHRRHLLLQHQLLNSQPSSPTSDSDATSNSIKEKTSDSTTTAGAQFTTSSKGKTYPGRVPGRRSSLKKSVRLSPSVMAQASSATNRAPKLFRRFRSRSLPIINYTSRSHLFQHHMIPVRLNQAAGPTSFHPSNTSAFQPTRPSYPHQHHGHHVHRPISSTPSLPPINLQSLKEIDLHEILKNPQLRHDILFDPQLQFRPNLDGERGRRKKTIMEKYWAEIESECRQFFSSPSAPPKVSRLPVLFTTLRDILLSLLPVKDRDPVNEIMDIDLLVQQLAHGSFDFVAMARWLGEVFKSHCAPMRDQWVSDMISKFEQAYVENSAVKLVHGLRSVFSILEAMKLDVANHQIRILRPVLIETAVDFEKDYFNQLINHCKIDISDSLKWFYRNFHRKMNLSNQFSDVKGESEMLKIISTSSIIDLLSCRNMATEFPSTMAFDHTRLVLLRADVRQLVCVQLCVVLFKQVLMNYAPASSYRQICSKPDYLTKVQEEILAIVTDDNGNVKWTRNVSALALQIVKKVVTNPITGEQVVHNLPTPLITFSNNWLIKQIQPSSDIYGLMEEKIFKELLHEIVNGPNFHSPISSISTDPKASTVPSYRRSDTEMSSIANRISTLSKFHWSVFGDYYTDYLKANQGNK